MVRGDRFNKNSITFNQDRCLYSRSVWMRCTLCIDSCPAKAISKPSNNNQITVDKALCVQCGQCLSACQLEAFESSSFSERQLLNRIEAEHEISLACFRYKGKRESDESLSQTYQLGTCLAALTPGVLFEISFLRECTLLTNQCHGCALFGSVAKILKGNMRMARLLLSDFDKSNNLRKTTGLCVSHKSDEPELLDDKAGSVFEATENSAIDDVIFSSIRSLFHSNTSQAQKPKVPFPLKKRRQYVPSWKLRLKDYWQSRRNSTQCIYPWSVLIVDQDRCKACGTCMQLCPTGAIQHNLSEGEFVYSFTPGICSDCGLCIMSCMSEALTRDYHPEPLPFDAQQCMAADAQPCARCGLPALNKSDNGLCYLCLSEPDPKSLTERVKRQMQTQRNSNTHEGELLI